MVVTTKPTTKLIYSFSRLGVPAITLVIFGVALAPLGSVKPQTNIFHLGFLSPSAI